MRRALAIAVLLSFGSTSAFAGEPLLESAVRVARKMAAAEPAGKAVRPAPPAARANFQQAPPGLESSGLKTRSKILIGLGVAAVFVGTALAIDSRVEDNTPSTKGERTTKPY